MDKISAVLSRFPQYAYNPDDKSSSLYKLIKSIVDEFNITMSNIDKIDKMLSIDTVLPEDIYNRFGALLDIKQNPNETNEQYRSRLKTSITALSGGTAEAIRYAIACGLGINDDPIAMERIKIYDAWKYDGDTVGIIKDRGYIVCDIDLNQGLHSKDVERIVSETANNVKASGVVIQFVYHNFRMVYYTELDNITYASMSTLIYSQVGE